MTKKNISKNKLLQIELSKIINPQKAVSRLKSYLDRTLVEKNFQKIVFNKRYSPYIIGEPFPKEYELVENKNFIIQGSLDEELWWTLQLINCYKEEINSFIILSDKYYSLFQHGFYDDANNCLFEIEKKFGLSNWLIESRIILLSKKDGLKEQKEYLYYVRDKLSTSTSTSLLTYYSSQKLESELSFEQFNKRFKKLWDDYPNIRDYFYIKCNPLNEKIVKLEDFIYGDSKLPVIDRYLGMKKAFYIILTDKNNYNLPIEKIKKYVFNLSVFIKDDELKPLLYNLKIYKFDELNIDNRDYVKALDYYTEGNYKHTHSICVDLINKKSEFWINIVELLVKCEIRDNEINLSNNFFATENMIKIVYLSFKSILLKDNLLIISVKKLFKMALELSSHHISNNILLFIHKNLKFYKLSPTEHSILEAKLRSVLYDIRNRDIFNLDERKRLIEVFSENYTNSTTYRLINLEKIDVNIPSYRENKYKILNNNNVISDENKISIYKKIIKEANVLDKFDAITNLSNLLFKIKRIEECIECVVDGYFMNNNLIYNLDIKELTEYITENHRFDFSNNICTSILYDLYSKYVSSSLDEIKAIRYEMFLEENGFTKASELIKKVNEFDSEKINHFLEFNCTMQIMDSSEYLLTTKEIEDERINICQFLVERDVSNKISLLKEIKNITESFLISNFITEIEQNKIYVNIEGIKTQLSSSFKEYYLRYNNLVNNVGDLRRRLTSQYIINNTYNINEPYPENDILPLLTNALNDTIEYFVYSSEYGLAGFLSTNIRHGKLYNFLTSSLLSSNLMIKKSNSFWQDFYKDNNDDCVSKLISALNDFTFKIDSLINNFIDTYIQIKTDEPEKENALFHYSFKKDIVIPLYNELEEEAAFEDFQNKLFDILWLKTEKNLEAIRNKIINELSIKFIDIFKELNQVLENIKSDLNLSLIRDSINRESTTIQRKIDNLVLWFTRQTSSNISDFEFNLPNNIVLEVINNVHMNHNLIIKLSILNEDLFKGSMLKGFVDILFILYDNAINSYKKEINSNLSKDFFLTFDRSNYKNNQYKLEVSNYINVDTNLDLLNQKLIEIKNNIRNKMIGHRVSTEGGTGFYKIVKILKYDLNLPNLFIDFYIDKKSYKFIVEIHFRRK
jgi:hypothetical protein